MAENETEEQQIDAIKEWWNKNGNAVIVGAVLGIGALVGWKGWGVYTEQQYLLASDRYAAMQESILQQDIDAVMVQAEQLKQEFSATPYASLASLMLAKAHAENVEYQQAMTHLQWVVDNAKQETLRAVARLRMIRLHIVEDRLEAAQLLLNQTYPLSFASLKEELRGDWHVSRGEFVEARAAYDSAIATAAEEQIDYLIMKRDNAIASEQSNV